LKFSFLKVTISIWLLILIPLNCFFVDFSALFKNLMEKSPEILSKKLQYESLLTVKKKDKDELKLLNAELNFNRAKCQELKTLVSLVYDYNISQLEFKKYTLLINLNRFSKSMSESPEILNFKLETVERKKDKLIKEMRILVNVEHFGSPELLNLENLDISLVFLDEQSLLNMSLSEKLLEVRNVDSVQEVLKLSIEKRNLKLELVDKLFELRNSFDLLNIYKTVHSNFANKINSIEDEYRAGKISSENYIKSQLEFIELKIKLLSQEKDFILRYLDILELLGLDVEKYLS